MSTLLHYHARRKQITDYTSQHNSAQPKQPWLFTAHMTIVVIKVTFWNKSGFAVRPWDACFQILLHNRVKARWSENLAAQGPCSLRPYISRPYCNNKNASSKIISVNCTGTKAVCILRSGCHLCFSFWDDEAFQIVFTNYLRDGRGWSREICRKFHGPVALYANVFTHAASMYLPRNPI